MDKPPTLRATAVVVWIALGAGAILRTVQYLAELSLWLDELAIALNIVERRLPELILQPLAYLQVAPVGFLAATEVSSWLLGAREIGLRLVPWLCSLLALLLFWRVARRFLGPIALATATTIFALSPAMVLYAGTVKQYSGDVMVSLLLTLLALRFRERPHDMRAALAAGGIGGAAVLFSQPGVLVAAGLGLLLLVEHAWSARTARRSLVALGAGWALGAAIATAFALFVVEPSTREYMMTFWSRGFMPAPWHGVRELTWLPRQWFVLLATTIQFLPPTAPLLRILPTIAALLAAPGVALLVRRDRTTMALLLVPVVVSVLASAARLFPLEGRVAIWTGPALLIVAAAGIDALAVGLPARFRIVAPATGVIWAGMLALLVAMTPPPYGSEAMRPVLETVARHAQPGDAFYVYYGARHAMRFYGPGLGLNEWIAGNCHRGDTPAYYREIDALRGRSRVWFIHTHALARYREPEAIRSYLAAIGIKQLDVPDPGGETGEAEASAVLFDLSDPVRLAAATADTHPVPPQNAAARAVPAAGPLARCRARDRLSPAIARRCP